MTLSIFSCACWPSVRLLWRNIYLGLLPIFWLGCLFFWYWTVWAVCKFWKLIPCSQIFPPVGYLFILFMVSFVMQKLLSLIRSHLFIFVFIFIILGSESKKILLQFMSKSVLPLFSYKNVIVSGFTFRSSIHFEFIFVYGIRKCSNFILWHVAVHFPQHHLLKILSFIHCMFLFPLSKISCP